MGAVMPIATAGTSSMRLHRARLVLVSMRPRHWVKNAFVLAGVVFAGRLGHPDAVLQALAVTAAFCLASGATYLVNDLRDAATDALNPRTALRPIARGEVSPRLALAAAAPTAALALALAGVVNPAALAVLVGYLALQLAYSYRLKHILFIDVMAIAAGFVLRAVAGGLAVGVPVSSWLLLSTGLLATFLGLVKRRGEATSPGIAARKLVRDDYTVPLLDSLIAVVTPATLVVYSLYAVNGARSHWMLLTVPFVLYGIFRVLYLLHRPDGLADEPALTVLRDRPLLACIVLWAATAAAIVAVGGAPR
jgi:4-hydroxybenzoate polyprenyltransferase